MVDMTETAEQAHKPQERVVGFPDGTIVAFGGAEPSVNRSGGYFGFLRDLPATWPYVRHYKRLAGVTVVLMALGALVGLLSPWPLAILIDSVLGDKPLPAVLGPLIGSWSQTALIIFAVAGGLV